MDSYNIAALPDLLFFQHGFFFPWKAFFSFSTLARLDIALITGFMAIETTLLAGLALRGNGSKALRIYKLPSAIINTRSRSWKELESKTNLKIGELKPGIENVSVRGRVLSTTSPRTIQTKSGLRTISEAVIGDETGRVKVTLWGKHAGTLKEGEAVEITNAWTSAYKGEVQINVSSKTDIKVIEDESIPRSEAIPEEFVKAPEDYRPQRGGFRGGRGPRRGGFRRSEE